ncbi:MAG: hypothetical protein KBT30_01485, partial [Clostridiales bacterium]|nr:hypothetical protein [Candidatus Apopatousia equi]
IEFTPNNETYLEPYMIFVLPLYDCVIEDLSSNPTLVYNVDGKRSLQTFSNIIEKNSGENPLLIDAQVIRYAPELQSVVGCGGSEEGISIPIFSISSAYVNRIAKLRLNVNPDVKKEYITKEYAIVSPEQSSKYIFNYYDYKNIADNDLQFNIKIALKPFNLISSCNIQPDEDSLFGITYESDLRGSMPTANGFEVSLSSNAFETYSRQNSNYQQFFDLDKQELMKKNQIEAENESAQFIANTFSSFVYGGVAGTVASGNPLVGVATGLATAATSGVTGALQKDRNDELRKYEEQLQQQRFDLSIGTIKNLPNSITRVSSFNEIIMRDFWYVVEEYECTDTEKQIVDDFIENYGYLLGVMGNFEDYTANGFFIRGTLIKSNFNVELHNIADTELKGGIYLYEQE